MHGVCLEHFVTSRVQKSAIPNSAQKESRTTFVVSFSWRPGQCKNYQQNSFLAPSPGELCMGCLWNVLSTADSKSQRFPMSAQKAGRTTFVASFSCLAEQCKITRELLAGTFPGGDVHGGCLERFVTGRLQKSAVPHLSPESR